VHKIRRYFVTGLLVIVPVFASLYLLVLIFLFFDNILGRFLNNFIKSKLGFFVPGLGLLFSLVIVFLTGFLTTRIINKKISIQLEKWFASLPLIKNIYPAFKQLASFMLAQKELGFQKVVLAEYPSKGIWSVGFLTNEQFPKVSKVFNKDMVAVFVPSSPGPLTGYVIFVTKDELRFPDLSVSDALKIIISGGVISLEG